tara:strand:+ start:1847 stop:2044 length:198 start_codon:yes stop_codon:yes gene_type:complete
MKQDNFIAIFFVVLLYVAVAWTVRLILLNYIQNFWLVWIIGLGVGAGVTFLLYKKVVEVVKDIFR